MLLYGDQSFNDYKRYFYFNCLNWIYNFNKTFWCSLISKLTHLFVYVQLIFRFCQEIACKFILFSFVFCILIIASFILFCKMIYIIRSFFSFYDYLCMFYHKSAKICSKSYNWIIFKLIFLYLIDFGANSCWLIPRYTKGYSAFWR